MKRIISVLSISLFALWLVAGCSNKAMPLSANSGNSNSATGYVRVTVKLGAIGLAKAQSKKDIDLDSLTMDLSATGEVPVHLMIPISGSGEQTVSQPFSLAPKTWTLSVNTYAMGPSMFCPPCIAPTVIHTGQTSFTVVLGDTSSVNMSVSSEYSMLLVRISGISDSANEVALFRFTGNPPQFGIPYPTSTWYYQWGDFGYSSLTYGLADTTFAIGSVTAQDTIKLRYDWLPVRDTSMNGWPPPQGIQVVISGSWSGTPMALSWGWLIIPKVTAGADTNYAFTLNWVGPGNVLQKKTVNVDVGAIGLITVDGAAAPSGLSKKK
jgi:hypothetical protein